MWHKILHLQIHNSQGLLLFWIIFDIGVTFAHGHTLLKSTLEACVPLEACVQSPLTASFTSALFAPATLAPSERQLLLVLGDSAAALRHLRVSSPVPTLVGRASQLQLLAARMSPGPTYGPRAGAASVAVLLVERRSHGDQVTSLVEKLQASALWTAHTKLILLLVDGDPSINLIPKDNSENASMAVHKDAFKDFKHILENTHNNGTRDFLNAISDALPENASTWVWNSTLSVFQRLELPPPRPPYPVRYMGWPCPNTLRHSKQFFSDVGDSWAVEVITNHVSEMRGVECVESVYGRKSNVSSFEKLAEGSTVMVGVGSIHIPHWKGVAEMLYPHRSDNLCLEMRHAKPLSFIENVLNIFSPVVYILVFITLFSFCILQFMIHSINPLQFSLSASIILHTVRCLIFGMFPAKNNKHIYLWILLSLCSMILTQGFLGLMTSCLSVKKYHAEINTLDEALNRISYICVPGTIRDTVCNPIYPEIFPGFQRKCVPCVKPTDFLRMRMRVIRGEPVALLTFSSFADLYSRFPHLQIHGRKAIRHMPQCVFQPSYSSFVVKKGLLYASKISLVVQYLVESGLRDKIRKDSFDFIVLKQGGHLSNVKNHNRRVEPLSIDTLKNIFIFLSFGLSVSSIAFVVELLFHRYHNKVIVL